MICRLRRCLRIPFSRAQLDGSYVPRLVSGEATIVGAIGLPTRQSSASERLPAEVPKSLASLGSLRYTQRCAVWADGSAGPKA